MSFNRRTKANKILPAKTSRPKVLKRFRSQTFEIGGSSWFTEWKTPSPTHEASPVHTRRASWSPCSRTGIERLNSYLGQTGVPGAGSGTINPRVIFEPQQSLSSPLKFPQTPRALSQPFFVPFVSSPERRPGLDSNCWTKLDSVSSSFSRVPPTSGNSFAEVMDQAFPKPSMIESDLFFQELIQSLSSNSEFADCGDLAAPFPDIPEDLFVCSAPPATHRNIQE